MARTVDYVKLVEFVAERRKATGGYGATHELPATVEDTYEAVELFAAVSGRAPVPEPPTGDTALAGYLGRVRTRPWLGLATTFQVLATCRRLRLAVEAERARHYAAAAIATAPSLETSYYVARLAHEVMGSAVAEWLGPAPVLVLPERRAVDHVRMLLTVKALLGQPVAEAAELAEWLRQSQNGDGGFGFFPGTTSFIENCHGALAALSLLDTQPADPAAARAFVISCQTGAGGFARNPGAAPFLDASWHAIRALALLEAMAY
jgi:hypothetical protein